MSTKKSPRKTAPTEEEQSSDETGTSLTRLQDCHFTQPHTPILKFTQPTSCLLHSRNLGSTFQRQQHFRVQHKRDQTYVYPHRREMCSSAEHTYSDERFTTSVASITYVPVPVWPLNRCMDKSSGSQISSIDLLASPQVKKHWNIGY